MRKIMTAGFVCLLVAGLAVAPGALAKKGPKRVSGTVTVTATNPPAGSTTTTATGNVKANSSCRKNRTVHLSLLKADGTPASSEVVTTTRSNGDYTATITAPAQPAPVPPAMTSPPTTYTLKATVDQVNRKSGKGKKAKKFVCLAIESAPVAITVS